MKSLLKFLWKQYFMLEKVKELGPIDTCMKLSNSGEKKRLR